MIRSISSILAVVSGLVVWLSAQPCHAHFLWLKTVVEGNQPHAFLFFGENVADEAYHLPDSLADATVWRRGGIPERENLPVKPWEGEDRIGLGAPLADGDKSYVLEASEQYGVYGTALLTYWAKHVHAETADGLNGAGSSRELKLDIVPRVVGNDLELTVLWEGKPLAGAEVKFAIGDAEAVEKKTNDAGRVRLKPEGKGLVGVLANRNAVDISGKLGDKSYNQELHYASLTFEWPVEKGNTSSNAISAKPQAALPEPLSSFGAAVADGWLYVYGGHIGTEHDHSAANLSNHFRRIRVDGGSDWEELPMQTPLQGLALLAHGGKIYRVGGMNARNATPDDDEDLHSTDEFAQFDPATNEWTALAPLPAPRSSHNAAVIDDRLYVVGGWALAGSPPGEWQRAALVYDLADPGSGWQKLPEPPFQRRALAVSHWNGKLVALGGLDEEGEVSQRVDMLDLQSGDWSEGPELPGDDRSGFGVSAWNLEGRLYVSGLRAFLYRLDDDGSAWKEVARLKKPRFFHQLVPAGGGLLAVGGASREGHIADMEWIDLGD